MFSTPLRNRTGYNGGIIDTNPAALNNNSGLNSNTNAGGKGTASPIQTNNNNLYQIDALSNTNLSTRQVSTNPDNNFIQPFNANTTAGNISTDLTSVNEHVKVSNLANKAPLELASEYIDYLNRKDNNTPLLDERSYYNNGVNYNFSKDVGGLGAFTPFERQKVINIPDALLNEASRTEIKSDIGLFPELNRCWIIIDNKLILWNINDTKDFQTIDEIKHTILNVALVKAKPGTFVDEIKNLLIIVTPFDIYLLAISYSNITDEITVFNTGMSVSINGMGNLEIVSEDKTGRIFFASKSNSLNIWELQYTGSDDWFNSKCNKICLTESSWSSLLPGNIMSMIPGGNKIHSFFEESSQETITQLTIDQSRGIIYSLSSRSIIRAYLISKNKLESPAVIEPSYISRIIGTTTARGAPILAKRFLKISKVIFVSQNENSNLFFVALTVGGVRLYFNGSIGRFNIEAIRLESIKFPPSTMTSDILQQEIQQQQLEQQKKNLPFYSSLSLSESILLKVQKKSSILLETTRASTIISPGIFFSAVKKISQQHTNKNANSNINNNEDIQKEPIISHRLFVSVPDYGILKNHGKYVENATFLDTTGIVKEIVPLTPLFNATNKPSGYANAFATQYTTDNLQVAVLTNNSVEIYKYRTPDEVFESLIDNLLPFALNYGLSEACSSALYVTCKFNKSDTIRSNALTFLTLGIPGVLDIKPRYNSYVSSVSSLWNKTTLGSSMAPNTSFATKNNTSNTNFNLDDVILSPRFYGIALLITRLLRDIWEKPIFIINPQTKPDFTHTLLKSHPIKEQENIISGVSVSKNDVDYYLSSIVVLNEFFANYGDSITRLSMPLIGAEKPTDKSEEVANQAENIAINSLIKLVESIKEALSFLNVLYEESEVDGFDHQFLAFENIFRFLKIDIQKDLAKLRFKDIFAPNLTTKSSIREILLCIINRSINRGSSIESTATTLQERCGSFCSTNDILSFRALEHLRKAKEIGSKDYDTLCYHLDSAIRLFQNIVDDLSIEKLKEAVSIMLELNYYPKAIEFLLNIAGSLDKGNLAYQYVANGSLANDERKEFYDKRIVIYDIILDALVKVDKLASQSIITNAKTIPTLNNNDAILVKDESYMIILHYDDKLFHYHMYDWLVAENNEDKLLELDTKYILPYLNEKSQDSLKITNLLWVYHSRKSNFGKAAEILYNLAISNFEIKLSDRIECLSRANGFCNSDCPPSQRQAMVELTSTIQELFDITGVQDDTLNLVSTDTRIDDTTREELVKNLNGKILPVSELFNDYAVPLGYHEIALTIFKISDFRDQEEIMSKWDELFNSLKEELDGSGKLEDSVNFIKLLSSVVIKVGRKVSTSEFVFPVSELFPKICHIFHENIPADHIKPGSIISIFISARISYNKLYYILKDLIETSITTDKIMNQEMTWLIKEWYKNDRKLKDIISYDDINNLDEYTLDTDPIEKYYKKTGNNI